MNARTNSRGDAALRDWGEHLRAHRRLARCRTRRMRLCAGVIGILVSALTFASVFPPAPRLVWNVSASAPTGLYVVRPYVARSGAALRRGDMVIARLPSPWRDLAAARRYLPSNVPLVKRVAAIPGDEVCGHRDRVLLNGRLLVARLRTDRVGRVLPWWEGCRRLGMGQYLLVMSHSAGSFDGRYFGPTQDIWIIGQARRVWAW